MSAPVQTERVRVDFGVHKDKLWTRVPISYLRWMVNSGHSRVEFARAELDRRGIPDRLDLELTGHAVDRASQLFLDDWQAEREGDEGLHSWLFRRAGAAVEIAKDREPMKDGSVRVDHRGICFAIQNGEDWPVIVTVMKSTD